MKKELKLFVEQLKSGVDQNDLRYDAGRVFLHKGRYVIDYSQKGAEKTFSVGQPVYNDNGDLLGYLGLGLFESLNYGADIRVPVEFWEIQLNTPQCRNGVHIKTYWQKEEGVENE